MTEIQRAALKRLRRKMEIMLLDQKAIGSTQVHDTREMLALMAIIEKENQDA